MEESAHYFRLDPEAVADEPGRFVDSEVDVEPVEFLPGLVFRPLIGKDLMVNFVRYEPRTVVAEHAHAEQQITFVIEAPGESGVVAFLGSDPASYIVGASIDVGGGMDRYL